MYGSCCLSGVSAQTLVCEAWGDQKYACSLKSFKLSESLMKEYLYYIFFQRFWGGQGHPRPQRCSTVVLLANTTYLSYLQYKLICICDVKEKKSLHLYCLFFHGRCMSKRVLMSNSHHYLISTKWVQRWFLTMIYFGIVLRAYSYMSPEPKWLILQ